MKRFWMWQVLHEYDKCYKTSLHEMTSVTRVWSMLQEHNKCYINMTGVIRIWMREDNHFLFKGQQVI